MTLKKESLNTNFSPDLKVEYGKFGGMYVPDPFSPALDGFADVISGIKSNADFLSLWETALIAMKPKDIEIKFIGKILNTDVYRTASLTRQFVISGYLALAKYLKLTPAFAVDSRSDLDLFLQGTRALDLKPYIALNKEIGKDRMLVETLNKTGAMVEVEKCETLFDDPGLYAFQYCISNISTALFIPVHSNVGPYPFLSITSGFVEGYSKILREAVDSELPSLPDAILAGGYPGTSAIAVFKAFENTDVRIISVEKPIDGEQEECYCGMYSKIVLRGEKEEILSPELIQCWENGDVDRVFAEDFDSAIVAVDQSGIALIVEED
ncbi:PALP domain-containing protein [Pelolinea submarina]|uniref:Uncharacterized protein n=1 Tax=Pelolinea submarina TaxID=913107 RepID=A0A347ZUD6_9CHLR|nr:hypothetical protein [Pelolinea submarina]REG10497.1 hypothetical protein DFR64_0355 [Pelolinea submarina]BBB48917.1 tryptophan synthase beta chain [Pelolinea submarina]